MDENGENAPAKPTQDKNGERGNEEEEVLVVSAANAVVHPRAVVIKILHRENDTINSYSTTLIIKLWTY